MPKKSIVVSQEVPEELFLDAAPEYISNTHFRTSHPAAAIFREILQILRADSQVDFQLHLHASQIVGCSYREHKSVSFAITLFRHADKADDTLVEFQRFCGDAPAFNSFFMDTVAPLQQYLATPHLCSRRSLHFLGGVVDSESSGVDASLFESARSEFIDTARDCSNALVQFSRASSMCSNIASVPEFPATVSHLLQHGDAELNRLGATLLANVLCSGSSMLEHSELSAIVPFLVRLLEPAAATPHLQETCRQAARSIQRVAEVHPRLLLQDSILRCVQQRSLSGDARLRTLLTPAISRIHGLC